MSDLISKEAAIQAVEDWVKSEEFMWTNANYYMIKRIRDLPSAEPERQTGKWINTGSGQECDQCREIQYGYDTGRNYCANCGAKMEVEDETNKNR